MPAGVLLVGVALNPNGNWNHDFVISKQTITLPHVYEKDDLTKHAIDEFGNLVGEDAFKGYNFPTPE